MEWREQKRWELAAVAAAALLLVWALVNTAWVCDDAYITFRTVDNFLHGHGLRWNVAERVQAYTHPLWMMLLVPTTALAGDPYPAALFLGLFFTLGAVFIFVRFLAPDAAAAVLGLVLLAVSKSFIDYGTSGLENPATYLLAAGFAAAWWKLSGPRRQWAVGLLAGLAALNRIDTVLLFAPALALLFWRERGWRTAARLAAGFLPLAGWEIFSLLYYGFPFPNTAYAKLHLGVDWRSLAGMGMNYLIVGWLIDPLGFGALAAGLALAAYRRRREELALAFGVVLYLAYLMKIGGDFMSGRFLALPIMLSIMIIGGPSPGETARPGRLWRAAYLLAPFLALVSLIHPLANLRYNPGYGSWPIEWRIFRHMVADERAYYYPSTGLLGPRLRHIWTAQAELIRRNHVHLTQQAGLGFFGLAAGPDIHIIDGLALSEPLLARIYPLKHQILHSGHFSRYPPRGYWDTLATGKNHILHPSLALYYDRLRLVISGPVFAPERLREIVRFNLGGNDPLLADYERSDLRLPPVMSTEKPVPGVFPPPGEGYSVEQIRFNRTVHPVYYEFLFPLREHLEVAYLLHNQLVGRQPPSPYGDDDVTKMFVPDEIRRTGFDAIQCRYPTRSKVPVIIPQIIIE